MNNKYKKILDIIYSSIIEVNKQQPPEYTIRAHKDEFLISEESSIDSLGMITLLINIEDKIQNEFNKKLDLVEEKLISDENSPIKTVDGLAKWLENNV